MTSTTSHKFSFKTPSTHTNSGFLDNIIVITQEEGIRHYVQYIQYWSENNTVYSRQVNTKVDRSYYLEVANIAIDDIARRRYVFSILGKRRFGANNKKSDYYLLNKNFDIEKINLACKKNNLKYDDDSYTEKTNYSSNTYKTLPLSIGDSYFVILNQLNCSKRKKLHKNYYVELSKDDFKYYGEISSLMLKVNYIFNKIGKIYFKSLSAHEIKLDENNTNIDLIASAQLKKHGFEMEMASRVDDNTVFRKLKDRIENIKRISIDLLKTSNYFAEYPKDKGAIEKFSVSIIQFGVQTKDIKQFEEITSYLTTIQMLAESYALAYLFSKNDNDFKDIFKYMIESFSLWKRALLSKDEDSRKFNLATIDLYDSLRYLVDICFKFKHEYELQNYIQESNEKADKEENIKDILSDNITSAEEYFQEIVIDSESYDELEELEFEINELNYIQGYDSALNAKLVSFFNGYTRVLNPLFEFKDLSYSVMVLSKKLEDMDFNNKEKNEMIFVLVKGLVSDLLAWKKSVLIEKSAENIHYMNKSFYSNISQIEILLEATEQNIENDIFF